LAAVLALVRLVLLWRGRQDALQPAPLELSGGMAHDGP
jgi:hypothetical protein